MGRTIQYIPPFDSPLPWREWDGETRQAIMAYFDQTLRRVMSAQQIELVRLYLEHYVNAPCWDRLDAPPELAKLKESVKTLKTTGELAYWIQQIVKLGMDPF